MDSTVWSDFSEPPRPKRVVRASVSKTPEPPVTCIDITDEIDDEDEIENRYCSACSRSNCNTCACWQLMLGHTLQKATAVGFFFFVCVSNENVAMCGSGSLGILMVVKFLQSFAETFLHCHVIFNVCTPVVNQISCFRIKYWMLSLPTRNQGLLGGGGRGRR